MSVYGELKRRNVFRVGIAYVITAWLLLQVIDVVAPMLGVPEWVPKSILLLLGVGFPIALLFAWAFELTPEGLKFERDVDRSQSVTHSTGRKLNYIIIAVLSIALALFALDKFVWNATSVEEDVRRPGPAILLRRHQRRNSELARAHTRHQRGLANVIVQLSRCGSQHAAHR
jgi:hypothetical protein